MDMRIQERVRIAPYTTFRMGGEAAYFCELNSKEEVAAYAQFASEKNLPLVILGGGSNSIFPDTGVLEACVGHIRVSGFRILREEDSAVYLEIGAGEEWDAVVERAVSLGLSGIEALSAIPGTAGATPIQNVGAYGQEIADTLVSVDVYDRKEKIYTTLAAAECGLAYRDSKFKHEWKGAYIIVSLTLRLARASPTVPAYPGVEAYMRAAGIQEPTLLDIRRAVIEIRKNKLPDPKVLASCGSFFKNPIISEAVAADIKAKYPDAVLFAIESGFYKAGAGWMIEKTGMKGRDFGTVSIYPKNALVMVNNGGATLEELAVAALAIREKVQEMFGITLEPEPVFISGLTGMI